MSAEDIWQLKIPIRLCLSSSEITSPTDVKPVYLLAPRHAYLPALAQQCLSFFQHVLLSLPGQAAAAPWFEQQGLALNWTQPLGVLHDLLSPALPAAAAADGQCGAAFSAPASPWCLTVHYRNMPGSLNNSWQNAGTSKDYYFSSLKEAGYCCRGSDGAGAVMRLPGQAQDDLWAAVNRGDGAAARHIITPLRINPTQKQGGSVAAIPVRLYIRRHKGSSSSQDLIGVWEQTYSSSRPVESMQPDGSQTLLAHLMHSVMPQHFPAPVPAPSGGLAAAIVQQQQQQQPEQQRGHQQQQPVEQQEMDSAAGKPADAAVAGAGEQETAAAAAVIISASDPLGATASTTADTGTGSAQVSSTADRGANDPAAAGEATPESSSATAGASGADAPSTAAAAAADQGRPPDASGTGRSAQQVCSANHVLPDRWPSAAVFVCGIQPDWCTPLAWLHANLRAADCFLYVVVHLLEP